VHKILKNIKLVVFDLDGVLVESESSWQALHDAFSVDNEENFQRYLRGEIDYREFMRSDIRLWGKASREEIVKILDRVRLMKGAKETVEKLSRAGYKTAIISSGISLLADRVKDQLGIGRSYANRILFDDEERLTGEAEALVTLLNKDDVLRRLAASEGLETSECAVVGDSRFDVAMFKEAGFSISFNSKDELVREAADSVIEQKDLRAILPLLVAN
jgi:phosphoserine phosphatase